MNIMHTLIKSAIPYLAAFVLLSPGALGCCGYGPASEPPVRSWGLAASASQPPAEGGSPTGSAPANSAPSNHGQPTTSPNTTMNNTPASTTPATPAATSPSGAKPEVKTERATFGGGCFWGVEEFFRTTKGVISTRVGYAGGKTDKPTYRQVCEGDTNHAEVVEITFDPSVVTYEKLVGLFFKIHDPTQVNRQGPDYGTQYRTVVFYHSPEQKATVEATIKRLTDAKKFKKPIATKVEPAPTFWPAEEYHQQYFFKNGIPNTCHVLEE